MNINFADAWPWLQWVLAAAAVVGFVVAVIKGVPPAWRALTTFVTTINDLSDLPAELAKQKRFRIEVRGILSNQDKTLAGQNLVLAKQDTKISEIHHEVQYNNGSSVKDGVRRVEKGVAGVEKGVAGLYEVTAQLQKELDELKKGKDQ